MRRVIVGLAATALTLLALAGPASAATGQVTKVRFSGSFAEAYWATQTSTSYTSTYAAVSKAKQGSELYVDTYSARFDANGNFTGATATSADVTSGFSYALKSPLASANLSASGLPATRCRDDANFNRIGCTSTTINVSVAWTGQGPISRGVENDHYKTDGFSVSDHNNGTFRNATANGTVAGRTLTVDDLQFADLSTTKGATTTVCIGNSC
ncbi:MAG: hypothetical protein ACTHQQ_22225 [Solirubrobacteraceae bacterium]